MFVKKNYNVVVCLKNDEYAITLILKLARKKNSLLKKIEQLIQYYFYMSLKRGLIQGAKERTKQPEKKTI